MRHLFVFCVLIACVCFACSSSESVDVRAILKSTPQTNQPAVAKINGRSISLEAFNAYWKAHPEKSRQAALDGLILQELLFDVARDAPLDTAPLINARNQGLARVWLDKHLGEGVQEPKLVGPQIKMLREDAYGRRYRPPGLQASHLLVRVPEEYYDPASNKFVKHTKAQREALFDKAKLYAQTLQTKLPNPATLEDLQRLRVNVFEEARAQQLDIVVDAHMKFPEHNAKFKALPSDWRQMVPSFAKGVQEAVQSKGLQRVSEPVKSTFGYHLIVVEKTFPEIKVDPKVVDDEVHRIGMVSTRTQALDKRMKRLMKAHSWQVYPEVLQDPVFAQ